MFEPGAHILLAVSGGADSMCMLRIFTRISGTADIKISAAHFNHMLRGHESERDETFVADFCRNENIPLSLGRGNVMETAKKERKGIEETARRMRYEFLEETARNLGCERIATAHTSGDNAETLLLNLIRGTGARGLSGIPPVRGKIIRPLLCLDRREILGYLEATDTPFVVDSSNEDEAFSRNRIRLKVVPELMEINPQFLSAAANAAALLREDEEYLDSLAREFIYAHSESGSLPISALLSLPRAISGRVIRLMAGRDISRAHTEAVRGLCASESPSAVLSLPGLSVAREYEKLIFGPEKTPELERITLIPGEEYTLCGGRYRIRSEINDKPATVHNSFNIFHFPIEDICGSISVRPREPGDKIQLAGRHGTRSLKKLFSDAKIPKFRRDSCPVLSDEQGVIAVYGFGISSRFRDLGNGPAFSVEIEETGDDK